MSTTSTADVRIADYGSVVIFTPMTGAARAFVDEHVNIPSWAWYAGGFAADHRAAPGLADAFDAHGLTVEMEA